MSYAEENFLGLVFLSLCRCQNCVEVFLMYISNCASYLEITFVYLEKFRKVVNSCIFVMHISMCIIEVFGNFGIFPKALYRMMKVSEIR
jgi:hypothetical protein